MTRWARRTLLASAVLIAGACTWHWFVAAPPNVTLENGARLEWGPCWFDTPFGRDIDCAHLYPRTEVQSSESVRLAVVVIRDHSWSHRSDPVLHLSGGPGGAAWLDGEGIQAWLEWVDEAQLHRDFIFYDRRGVGMSTPRLACPELLALYRDEFGFNRPRLESLQLQHDSALRCKQRLVAEGHDLASYSTTQSVRDLQDLMATMGANEWNIYAVSYGTRLALRAAPEVQHHLRSMTLDSVYPLDKHSLLSTPGLVNEAFARLFAACAARPECDAAYPDLAADFAAALHRLETQPLHITAEHWQTGESIEVVVNADRFLAATFQAMYSWYLIEELPRTIAAAARGDATKLVSIVEAHVNFMLDDSFSDPVFFSVECADTPPIPREQYVNEAARYPLFSEFLRHDWDYDVCREWISDSARRTPTTSMAIEVPTLLLSGEFDPVTPAHWAEDALGPLATGYHFTFKGIGHDVLGSDECATQLWQLFLAQPRDRPQLACVSEPLPVEFRIERAHQPDAPHRPPYRDHAN